MKKNYVEIKKWECEKADGTVIDISVGDTVRVTHNLTDKEVSKEFLEEYKNEVMLEITKLNSRNIEGKVVGAGCMYLLLYPKNITDIEKQ